MLAQLFLCGVIFVLSIFIFADVLLLIEVQLPDVRACVCVCVCMKERQEYRER